MEKYTFVKGKDTKRQDTLDFQDALEKEGWKLEKDEVKKPAKKKVVKSDDNG